MEYGIENDEVEYVPRSPSYVPTSPSISTVQAQAPDSPHQQPNEGLLYEDVGPFYISTLPSFVPFMSNPQVYDNRSYDGSSQTHEVVSQHQVTIQNSEPLALEDSSQEGLVEHQENHFGRIEPNHRQLFRRFRLASPYRADLDYGVASLSMEDYIFQETMASEGFVETSETRSHKVAESLVPVDTKEETKDQDSSASNF
ncbi:hypothetical protein MRB53_003584 [Persea americana]|uniref:Uncharacterized protein n=1 Tax=Persea americana TaxID=3435 RepID=A0ACC2MXR4_PERAE|nr:hypothetical protein MRB53_003584 [Persea americana]